MGQTIKKLAEREIKEPAVFNNRFVVEVCEKVHVHYRNLRILMSLTDFISMARGMSDALKRWEKLGSPEPDASNHIELCRKDVATEPQGSGIAINLNKNLYVHNEGRVFAEGANFSEPIYIHLKTRDLRLELSTDEFDELAEAVIEAKSKMVQNA